MLSPAPATASGARCGSTEETATGGLVSADGAAWIEEVVSERCPNAALCLDPFHVVQWASAALDEVRRGVWNAVRLTGQTAEAKTAFQREILP